MSGVGDAPRRGQRGRLPARDRARHDRTRASAAPPCRAASRGTGSLGRTGRAGPRGASRGGCRGRRCSARARRGGRRTRVTAGAHREAAAHYASALRHASSLGPAGRAALLERLGFECSLTFRLPEATDAYERALAAYRGSGDRRREGDVENWLSPCVERRRPWPRRGPCPECGAAARDSNNGGRIARATVRPVTPEADAQGAADVRRVRPAAPPATSAARSRQSARRRPSANVRRRATLHAWLDGQPTSPTERRSASRWCCLRMIWCSSMCSSASERGS